ncbi:MAG: hypothetical protein NTY83_01430 [Candidatus Micrarchaeota archaeon]|nr:hypothetical protein [Candidatus Micrarchaeota archaeon]
MKPAVHDIPYAKPQEAAVKNAPRRARNIFAAKAAAFMLVFSHACSAFTPAQEPARPTPAPRVSGETGKVGAWSFSRLGDVGYRFTNAETGAEIVINSNSLTIRGVSIYTGSPAARSIEIGNMDISTLRATGSGGGLVLTISQWNGNAVDEFTISGSGGEFQPRRFVKSR